MPLFLEELTKTIIESGLLREADGHYALDGVLPPRAIPTTLHDLLMARLIGWRLVRQVAQMERRLGRQFSPPSSIGAVASDAASRTLDDFLRSLWSAELIYRRGNPPDAEYTFKHALVQDAAYSTSAAQPPATAPCPYRRRPRRRVPGDRLGPAGTCSPTTVRKSQPNGEGGAGGSARRRGAGVGAVSDGGSRRACCAAGWRAASALPDAERARNGARPQIALGQALEASRSWGAPELTRCAARTDRIGAEMAARAALRPVGEWADAKFAPRWSRQAQRLAELRELGDTGGDVLMQGMGADRRVTCFELGTTHQLRILRKVLSPL